MAELLRLVDGDLEKVKALCDSVMVSDADSVVELLMVCVASVRVLVVDALSDAETVTVWLSLGEWVVVTVPAEDETEIDGVGRESDSDSLAVTPLDGVFALTVGDADGVFCEPVGDGEKVGVADNGQMAVS